MDWSSRKICSLSDTLEKNKGNIKGNEEYMANV